MVLIMIDDDGTEYRWNLDDDGRQFDKIVELVGEPDTVKL